MGVSVLILGHSGSGKSTSLRNFAPGEIGVFNVIGKPLPFRGELPKIDNPTYLQIDASLAKNKLRAYCIDDAGYLMQMENIERANEAGWGKYTDMQGKFAKLLKLANHADNDTITYFLMHPDYDANGRMKPKTIGKLLDEKLDVAGMFPIVLIAERTDAGYCFITQTDGSTPAKSPMGMFEDERIDNDLKLVDTAIREYWDMQPLTAESGE